MVAYRDYYCIAKLGKTYGYKGYLHVSFYSETSYTLSGVTVLCSCSKSYPSQSETYTIEDIQKSPYTTSSNASHGFVPRISAHSTVKLREIPNKEVASSLVNSYMFVSKQDLPPRKSEEYFLHELIGLTVHSQSNEQLGIIVGVVTTMTPVLLEIQWSESGRTSYIPFIKEYFSEVQKKSSSLLLYMPELKI